ncbi:hypothetical protein RQP46_005234 [Phenoliferia psychrophenolica]
MHCKSLAFAAYAVAIVHAANPESFNKKRAADTSASPLAPLTDPLAGVLGLVTGLLGGILAPLGGVLVSPPAAKVAARSIPAAHDHTARATAPDYGAAIDKLEATLEKVKQALKAKKASKRDDAAAAAAPAVIPKGQFGAGSDPVIHCFGICEGILSSIFGGGASSAPPPPPIVVGGGGYGGDINYGGGPIPGLEGTPGTYIDPPGYGSGSITYDSNGGAPSGSSGGTPPGFQVSGSMGGGSVDLSGGVDLSGYNAGSNGGGWKVSAGSKSSKRATATPDYAAAIDKLEATLDRVKKALAAKQHA